MEEGGEPLKIVKLPHHEEEPLCDTRAKYRQGKKLTAVKVYTVADESRHLILRNVTSVDVQDELAVLCQRFGPLAQFGAVDGYETERFTRVYHVQYSRIAAARFAKVQLDDRSFFGTHLKACYAPELETLEETADKLRWRRLYYRNGLARWRQGKPKRGAAAAAATAAAASETTPGPTHGDREPPPAEPAAPLIGPAPPLPEERPGPAPPLPGERPGAGPEQVAPPAPSQPPAVRPAPDRPRKRIVFKRKRGQQDETTGAAPPAARQTVTDQTADRLTQVREQIQQAVLRSQEKRRRCEEPSEGT